MKIPKKHRTVLFTSITSLLALSVASVTAYHLGYVQGEKNQKPVQNQPQSLDNAFRSATNLFRQSASGTITNIEDTQITIKLTDGTEQKITLTDKTVYLKDGKTTAKKDLQKGQRITALLSQIDRTQATRITLK